MELAPADAIVLRPQELGGQPAPWLAYWAFYLIVIGIFTHVGAAWLGCKKFIAWWKTLHTPRGYPWTWWKAETSTENYINNTLDSEDEEWEEAWDMDQPRDYLDTYLDWGPASGIRRRSTRPEEPQPEPWRNLLNSMARQKSLQLRTCWTHLPRELRHWKGLQPTGRILRGRTTHHGGSP